MKPVRRFSALLAARSDRALMVVAIGLGIALLWKSAAQLTPEEQIALLESESIGPGLPDMALPVDLPLLVPRLGPAFREHLP
jgi:hypothetical protein